ncbi:MAG: DUF192 domain-containing protein [Candidatus Paceibacterota bacterium]
MKKFLALALSFFLLLLIIAFYQVITSPFLEDFPRQKIELGQQELKVAVADNDRLRRQGLRDVRKLKNLDGMLFIFPTSTQTGFTMEDTLMSLQIAFYSSDGDLVDAKQMKPCTDKCRIYKSKEKFKYVLEIPQQSGININRKLKP